MSGSVPTVRLADVAELNPPLPASLSDGDDVSFMPMAAVDADSVTAVDRETRPYLEVSKGYTPFIDGDVLVAKITPCFENGKIAQARLARRYGFGSTEFHVVRARNDRADARYLVHFLRQECIRKQGESRMTGSAGQRRVPAHFLAGLTIPLPPLHEQRRIAEILDKADALRAKRRAALAQLDTLTQSIFLDMFGDPATNARSLPSTPLGEVAHVATGGTPSRDVEGHFGGRIAWVKTTEVGREDIHDTEEKLTDAGLRAIRGKLHPVDSIVVAMYGQGKTRGQSALLVIEAAVNQACAVIYPSSAFEPRFLLTQLRLSYEPLRALGRGGNQENLNLELVRSFRVLMPAKPSQIAFVEHARLVEAMKATNRQSLEAIDALFTSLQHRAFRGEL